jgi:tRNA-dihydrouridine synthase
VCLIHLTQLCGFYGEQKGVVAMRRILHEYFSGCRHVNDMKQEVLRAASFSDVQALVDHVHEEGSGMLYRQT